MADRVLAPEEVAVRRSLAFHNSDMTMIHALCDSHERLRAERDLLRAALYPLVVGCLEAEAREDAPEFVNGEPQRGVDALGPCAACGGKGATNGRDYVDEPIPEAVRCIACSGWGFTQ